MTDVKYLNMDTQQLVAAPPVPQLYFSELINVPGFEGGLVVAFSNEPAAWDNGVDFVDQGRETAIRLIAAEKAAKARPIGETFVTVDDIAHALFRYGVIIGLDPDVVSGACDGVLDKLEERIAARNQTGA